MSITEINDVWEDVDEKEEVIVTRHVHDWKNTNCRKFHYNGGKV